MSLSPRAGEPAQQALLVNVPQLMTAYYAQRPDPSVAEQLVAFGTSGHRGSADGIIMTPLHNPPHGGPAATQGSHQ